jgi:hypothetical protein
VKGSLAYEELATRTARYETKHGSSDWGCEGKRLNDADDAGILWKKWTGMINVADSARSMGSTRASNIAAGERHSHTEVYRRLRCYRSELPIDHPACGRARGFTGSNVYE